MKTSAAVWGGLSCVVEQPAKPPQLAVMLCHGFGAPGDDLVGLADYFYSLAPALREQAAFIFPAAPLDLAPRGMPGGRAWWWIDLNRLLTDMQPAKFAEFRRGLPPELPAAREALAAVVRGVREELGLAANQIVLGGFSQGAMMAVEMALHLPEKPAGLCLFSGASVNETQWREKQAALAGIPVFQSHGQYDPILPIAEGERLSRFLTEGGAKLTWAEFRGQHEIPPSALQGAAKFLAERLPAAL